MADMKAQARGAGSSSDAGGSDPFADLANLFETEVKRMGASAEIDAAFEDEFADALALDVARDMASSPSAHKAANSAQQGWAAPRAVRLTDPSEDRGGYGMANMGAGQRSALSLQADLEQALRGLSAPANPRQSIVVETQSFAPQRVVDEPIEDLSEPEMDDFDKLIASELAMLHRSEVPRASALPLSGAAAHRPLPSGVDYTVAMEDGEIFDDEMEEDAPRRRRRFLSRGMVMLGGGVAALALIGAIGISVLSKGEGSSLVASGDPLLIKADTTPFKMVPKEPGGRSIPNQNKAVYDRVSAPAGRVAPQQSALLTDAEEPLDLPAEEARTQGTYDDENLPGVELVDNENLNVKDESRVQTAAVEANDGADVPVLQPRKVKTMSVRPDGTLVQSAAPVAAAPEPSVSRADPALAGTEVAAAPAEAAIAPVPIPAATKVAAAEPRAEAPVPTPPRPAPVAAPAPVAQAAPPAADPIEVAAIQPAPAPAAPSQAAGGYYVQISSQPSEALAQSSMQSLGSRFASVIAGRSVGIQAAEIPGKGTFYRVRVAAESKTEAANLCNRLKAAGGNCFVAR